MTFAPISMSRRQWSIRTSNSAALFVELGLLLCSKSFALLAVLSVHMRARNTCRVGLRKRPAERYVRQPLRRNGSYVRAFEDAVDNHVHVGFE